MKKCKFLPNPDYEDWIPAKFHRIYQHSKIVAVVEDNKGLYEVEVWRVKDIKIDDKTSIGKFKVI